MKKYVCPVCGFVYDEAKGVPEAGIASGTTWEMLPDDWVCPICGAAKSEFTEQGVDAAPTSSPTATAAAADVNTKEFSPLEMSALCSNLARGCEKQYKPAEAALFTELAGYYKTVSTPAEAPTFARLRELVERDLENYFPAANAVAIENNDRGARRALTWSEKVTLMLKSLLMRYEKEGDDMFANKNVYVCTICGFVYIGDNQPELCPVCKAPGWKLDKIEERAM